MSKFFLMSPLQIKIFATFLEILSELPPPHPPKQILATPLGTIVGRLAHLEWRY